MNLEVAPLEAVAQLSQHGLHTRPQSRPIAVPMNDVGDVVELAPVVVALGTEEPVQGPAIR